MAGKKIPIEIDLSTRKAQQEVKRLTDELGKTEDGLDDASTAAQRVARVMSMSAESMKTEIDGTRSAVDALESALGEVGDIDVKRAVADLKAMGLTTKEIEADAEHLAAAMREVADVKVHAAARGFDDIGQAVHGAGDEAARTHSTVANFVGNSVEEIPGISGALGPVITGFGQLAEGAAEGEINVKQLVKAGAAFGAMAFVLDKVQGHFARIAKHKAWEGDQVDAYVDSLEDAESAADAVEQKLRDARDMTFSLGQGMMDLDLTSAIQKSGISVEQLSELIAGGREKIDEFKASMDAAGVSSESYGAAVAYAYQEAEFFAGAQDASAAANEFFGKTVDEATEAIDNNAEALDDHMSASDLAASKLDHLGRRWDAFTGNLSDDSALIDVQEGFESVETAALEAFAAAKTGAADAGQKSRDYQREIIAQKLRIAEYIEGLGGIPPEKLTSINAAIDQGDYNLAEWALAQLARERFVSITPAVGAGRAAASSGAGQGAPRRIHDGGIAGGQSFAGLRPDEVPAILQKGEAVLTGPQQAAFGGGGGMTINLTVNAGMGTDGNRVAQQIVEVLNRAAANGGAKINARAIGS